MRGKFKLFYGMSPRSQHSYWLDMFLRYTVIRKHPTDTSWTHTTKIKKWISANLHLLINWYWLTNFGEIRCNQMWKLLSNIIIGTTRKLKWNKNQCLTTIWRMLVVFNAHLLKRNWRLWLSFKICILHRFFLHYSKVLSYLHILYFGILLRLIW